MSDTKFFRQYLDILNEGPPPGVGPNAPARPATPQQTTQPNAAPSQYQQAKDAVGQQVQNYKDISGQIDQGVKQGQLDQKTASAAKSDIAGTMMRGGYEAGKAAIQGRDPSSAYVGSMIRSMGNTAADSGLDAAAKKIGPEMNKYRGPNAQDIRNDPAFKKASPEQQAQALKDYETIRNISDEDWAYYTSGKAFKELGGQAAQAGQDMIDQKNWGTGGSAGFSPKANELFGLDPTRQATDAEMQAAATGTQPTQPAPAATQTTQPQGTQQPTQQPTNEEADEMDEGKLMRKYMDFLDEAPATTINPNDPNAAAFGKQINAPAPNTNTNIDTRATAQRDKLAQQMSSGKINSPAPQTVNPNQQYGGGYDPNKVQYASGGQTASAQQSAAADASKKNAIGGLTQVASSQPVNNQSSGYTAQSQAQKSAPVQQAVNNQSSGYTAQSQAQNTLGANTQKSAPTFTGMQGNTQPNPTFTGMAGNPQQIKGANAQRASEPSLASQYIQANQPQSAPVAKPVSAPASEPSLASQYVQANQPQAVAEEEHDGGDELLKSIIRLIKQ